MRYSIDIIVGTTHRGQWAWYLSEKEYWFLDQVKWAADFFGKGYDVSPEFEDRFGIPVVDNVSVDAFLTAMKPYKMSTSSLSHMLLEEAPKFEYPDEIVSYYPALFIDFDAHRLVSAFPEPASFEAYVPSGWTGTYGDFPVDEVPSVERYWIVDGADYFLRYRRDGI
jgi:hypothetical protein